MTTADPEADTGGIIGWLVQNKVTPNLLMIVLLLGGALAFRYRIQKEVFPNFDLDTVSISVDYPGAGPEEVERSIILAIETELAALDGIKEVRATASEGRASVIAELRDGAARQVVLQDIQQAVAAITTLPDDTERPTVTLSRRRREVLDLQIFGDVDPLSLRNAAEEVRDALLLREGISQVELEDSPAFEILVEIPNARLREHGLTIPAVEAAVRAHSQEVPSGKIETRSGEILLRLAQRADWAEQYATIPIVAAADGSRLLLGDLATVREGFEEVDRFAIYNGQPNITLEVFRVGDQTPIDVSETVRTAMEELETRLPDGIDWFIPSDRSSLYRQRRDLLLKNLFMGLLLVVLVLGLFLEVRLAFWVMMGIPISFLGAMMFLPEVGITFNIISMFAFIVALGIVVDDAIVVGENIYERRERGESFVRAAIGGTRDVATPVIFAIVTNVIAFLPLLLMPGIMGKVWRSIPFVVISVFLVSLVESLVILPVHLAHGSPDPPGGLLGWISGWQQAFSRWFARAIERYYGPVARFCIHYRVATLTFMIGILVFSVGYFQSGRLSWQPFPSPESDRAVVTAVVPLGSPRSRILEVNARLLAAAEAVIEAHGGDTLSIGTRSRVNDTELEVSVFLTDPETRPISTARFVERWRERAGEIIEVESLRFESDRGGPGGGAAIDLQLSHRDVPVLERAAADLARHLEQYPITKDIDSGVSAGKPQLDLQVKPRWEHLGLSAQDVARQVRAAYQGVTAVRQQRGAHEVTLRLRLPASERRSPTDLSSFLLQVPGGGEVPLTEAVDVTPTRAPKSIQRLDGRRITGVSAGVSDPAKGQLVMNDLQDNVLPRLMEDYPGLTWRTRGRRADVNDSLVVLFYGLAGALAVIYFVLAIPFGSYVQPLVVMIAIPFGVVGAVIGHMLMGYTASLISVLGVIALSGVVVNDSLVLITYANQIRRDERLTAADAIARASIRRFRPILLTTLTTFMGLAPMIFETSRQARFIIPMAISLGYGIVFATAVTLIIVPSAYVLLDDVRRLAEAARNVLRPSPAEPTHAGA